MAEPWQGHSVGFLGLELNTEAMEICLPQAKLDHLRSIVTAWRGRKACRKYNLLSLTGNLSNACTVRQPELEGLLCVT